MNKKYLYVVLIVHQYIGDHAEYELIDMIFHNSVSADERIKHWENYNIIAIVKKVIAV